MSEATLDTKPAEPAAPAAPEAPEAPEAPAKLDFERAEFGAPAARHVQCSACQSAITTAYYQLLDKVLCSSCRDAVNRSSEDARSTSAFGRAFLLAGGVALGCGVVYALFVHFTRIQLALATIGIGVLVGRVIQSVTRGFGSTKHQVLAVVLTYLASAMGYLPAILAEMNAGDDTQSLGLIGSIVYVVLVSAFTLIAPLLDIMNGFSGILGVLIIFFGLRTAWQVSRGVGGPIAISGPYQVNTSPSPTP
ncbi:hypothetical protein [Polyangium mundeleinium]|uniref:Uncharacterized protein n=1 Tax=Polyangium mundeleinium TaxID=2995306 RepID=A0ABT5EQ01_9BACT|nr:hypothetical protein [Polyangium mundeleinium]MDC0743911.1 hypothetical protein [Polyangium mundeleinium]